MRALLKALFLFICFPSITLAASKYNMTPGVTPISHDIYNLHMTIFWICVAIGIVVFGILTYSLIKHRKSAGVKAATFHEHTYIEIIWAVIPFLILVVMAIPATIVLIRMNDESHSDITVKITGYQWKWKYDYLNQGISFFSNLATPLQQIYNQAPKSKWYLLNVDKPLVLPIHKKVRFLITSNDVIHSWWVPALGVKKDAIPGFITEAWARINKPGTYRGQCAELCGINHGYMPIVVVAKPEQEFKEWVQKEKDLEKGITTKPSEKKEWDMKSLMKLGEQKYNMYCAVCHKPDGTGIPPTFPALKGSSIATGKPISRHVDIILDGVPGTAMQAFATQLNDADIAAITTYERNAWGNNTGDVVMPDDVSKERAKPKREVQQPRNNSKK